jgi:hypothetical protein
MKKIAITLIVAATALAAFVSFPIRAWAVSCGEETLFVQKGTNSSAYGSNGEIYVRNRNLVLVGDCSDAESHSTAHVENSLETKFAEIGFVERWYCTITGCTKTWKTFVEGNDGSKPIGQFTYGGFDSGTTISSGHWARFKVNNVAGTNKWNFWYEDNVNGGGYTQIAGTPGLNFSNGLAFGETGRRGDPGSGADDHHEGLLFKNSSGSWNSWGSNSQAWNHISGYYYDYIAKDEYKVCSNSTGCPA